MMSNSEARKRLAANEARDDVAARIVHRLTCSRCRMGWACGGLGEEDYERATEIADLLAARDEQNQMDGYEKGMLTPGSTWMKGRAEAWDEGYDHGDPYHRRGNPGEGRHRNPYRAGVDQ